MSKEDMKELKKQVKRAIRGPFRSNRDKLRYRHAQDVAIYSLNAAVSDLHFGAVKSARLLIENSLSNIEVMEKVIEKGRRC